MSHYLKVEPEQLESFADALEDLEESFGELDKGMIKIEKAIEVLMKMTERAEHNLEEF